MSLYLTIVQQSLCYHFEMYASQNVVYVVFSVGSVGADGA